MAEIERKTLKIKGVQEIQSFGTDGQKLPFSAELDGKEQVYITYSKRLFPYIKPDTSIEADVETIERTSKSGSTFTDRKITQIYEGGRAVAFQGQRQGGYRKSPEELAQELLIKNQERASIEAQVTIKAITELLTHDQCVNEQALAGYWQWINARLGNHTTPAPKTPRFQSPEAKDWTVEQGETSEQPAEKQFDRGKTIYNIRQEFKKIGCTEKDWLFGHNYSVASLTNLTDVQVAAVWTKITTEYKDLDEKGK